MKYKDLARELENLGYAWNRASGGHQVFVCPFSTKSIVVSYDNKEIWKVLANKYLKIAKTGIKEYKKLVNLRNSVGLSK